MAQTKQDSPNRTTAMSLGAAYKMPQAARNSSSKVGRVSRGGQGGILCGGSTTCLPLHPSASHPWCVYLPHILHPACCYCSTLHHT
jgi:hypothetical protein